MAKVFVKPATLPDGTVLSVIKLPAYLRESVKPEGELLEEDRWLRRRIADGDLVRVAQPSTAAASPAREGRRINNPASE
jgi:hypothetical protein